MDDLFKYQPLEHPWQLRLVELLPQEDDDEVRCNIKVINGDDAQDLDPKYDIQRIPYHALSYTWGNSKERQYIILDGKLHPITTNLYAFLKQTRPKQDPPHHLWIDAISIDQSNPKEKSEQVGRMTSIYTHATGIALWLGPAEDDSDLAMDWFRKTADVVQQNRREGEIDIELLERLHRDKSFALIDGEKSEVRRLRDALQKLLNRSWWSRVWITQEATVPRKPAWILCGDREVHWASLGLVIMLLSIFGFCRPGYEYLSHFEFPLSFLTIQADRASGGEDLRLLSILAVIRGFQATDHRDRVYAVLGIAGDLDPNLFPKPDYSESKTVKDVYREVAAYLLSASPYNHMLDFLGHTDDPFSRSIPGVRDGNPGAVWNIFKPGVEIVSEIGGYDNLRVGEETTRQLLTPYGRVIETLSALVETETVKPIINATWLPPGVKSQLEEYVELSEDQIRDFLNLLRAFQEFLGGPFGKRLVEDGLPSNLGNSLTTMANYCENAFAEEFGTEKASRSIESSTEEVDDPPISVIDETMWPWPWPSWLPDWRCPQALYNPFLKCFRLRKGQTDPDGELWKAGVYAASGHDLDIFRDPSSASELVTIDGDEFRLRGFMVDRIKSLAALKVAEDMFDETEHIVQLYGSMPSDLGENYVSTGENVSAAFWRTVAADICYEGHCPAGRGFALSNRDTFSRTARFHHACSGRKLAITSDKLMGLVPRDAEVDDEIYVLAGGQVLYVLRPQRDCFRFVGECYLHGFMDGEALERLENGTAHVDQIRLV